MLILKISLLIISVIAFGISKSITDISESGFSTSKLHNLNPLFWNKHESWKNKWKNDDSINGEKFLGSSTIFVWLTDAWHMFNGITYVSCFSEALLISSLTNNLIIISIPFILSFVVFELIYRMLK